MPLTTGKRQARAASEYTQGQPAGGAADARNLAGGGEAW